MATANSMATANPGLMKLDTPLGSEAAETRHAVFEHLCDKGISCVSAWIFLFENYYESKTIFV